MGYVGEFQLKNIDELKENAATSAKVNGVQNHKKHDISCKDNTTNCDSFASDIDDLQQRVQRAADALNDLEPWQAEKLAARVLKAAGSPLPAFLGGMDDARHWASFATTTEIECHAAACLEAMPAHRQAEFAIFVGGIAA